MRVLKPGLKEKKSISSIPIEEEQGANENRCVPGDNAPINITHRTAHRPGLLFIYIRLQRARSAREGTEEQRERQRKSGRRPVFYLWSIRLINSDPMLPSPRLPLVHLGWRPPAQIHTHTHILCPMAWGRSVLWRRRKINSVIGESRSTRAPRGL